MVKLNEKKAQSELIFLLCRGIKQGIDCDSVLPEGCVLTVLKSYHKSCQSLYCDRVGCRNDIISSDMDSFVLLVSHSPTLFLSSPL